MNKYESKSERDFNNYVMETLSDYLKEEISGYNLKIGNNKKILKDVTVIPDRLKSYQIILGFADVDIAIYREDKFDLINTLNKIKGIKLESIRKEKFLLIPFVVIELKLEKVTSHSLIVDSHKINEMRDKFPYCSFYMIIKNTNKKLNTIIRQAKNFDRVLVLEKQFNRNEKKAYPKDSINDIIEPIKLHLKKLAEQEILLY